MLVRKGLISQAQLNQALASQYGRNIKLGELLIDNHVISPSQLNQVIKEQKIMLGELLLEERLINPQQLWQTTHPVLTDTPWLHTQLGLSFTFHLKEGFS